MLKRADWPAGEVVEFTHNSQVLRGNALGDPHIRTHMVWLPPQYRDEPRRRFPVLYDLAGYTGSGPARVAWKNFDENMPERLARLVHEGAMAPAIVVFPDCFTALGGNQYVNSSAIGQYAEFLVDELVPAIDVGFRTLATRDSRGCFGKSSGGYGAIVHAMKYPEVWGAIANHAGDSYFDFVYRSDWPNTLRELEKYRQPSKIAGAYKVPARTKELKPGYDDGRVRRFLEAFWACNNPSGAQIMCLMNLAMAATYDPDPRAPNGFRIPFDLETGAVIEECWARWLAYDPVNMVGEHAANLKTLRGIWIDCGWRDQYHIQYGCRQLSAALHASGVRHRYEEFDGTHSGIDYRLDQSLPYLTKVLKKR